MDSKQKNEIGFKDKVCLVFSNITVEPVIILFMTPSILLSLSIANLHLEKACRVKLHLNETVCDGLAIRNTSMYTPEDESLVQKQVASMNAWKTIIQSVIPSVLLLSFGAWSDKRQRRKPMLILPIIGEIITVSGFILCTYFFYEFSMEVTALVETLPTGLTGGWFTMFMAAFSYIADTSTVESRTARMGAVNICATASVMVGMSLSGVLYKAYGLYTIFTITLALYIINLIYAMCAIKEKGKAEHKNQSKWTFFTDFFNIKHVKSTFEVAYRRREKNMRTRILATLLLQAFIFGPMYGEMNIVYLFVRKSFQWGEMEFSIYYTINVVVHLIGTVFALSFLTNYLKIDDSMLGIIATVGKLFSAFVYAFAPNAKVFCVGMFVELLSGTVFVAVRSSMSKLVAHEELGKINALTGICESLMPLAYGSMYNLIYNYTIDTLPGAFYLVGSAFYIPSMAMFYWLYVQNRKDRKELEERKNAETLLGTEVVELNTNN